MDKAESQFSTSPGRSWLRPYGVVLALYLLATWFTDAHSMGDTRLYVADILGGSGYEFWDFGHVLWRPLGWVFSPILHPLTGLVVGDDLRANVTLTLMAISWVTGLLSVLLVHALANKFCRRGWIAYVTTLGFLFTNAFLNYTQTGHSYVPGLSLLLLGLFLLVKDGDPPADTWWPSLIAGLALAGAVGLWFPYVLSVPAILASPAVLFGFRRVQYRLALQASLAFALVIALIYGAVMVHLGIYSPAGLKEWITSSAHGIAGMKGLPRMVFGFARSLINMGNDGRLFKRYILHDPLNPVSLFDLLRLSFWKLILFYLFFFSILVSLFYSRLGKRVLALLGLSAVPLVVFALFLFESGTIDRYLPLYPVIFLALAVSLCSERSPAITRILIFAFIAAAAISNVTAMSKVTLNREQEKVAARIRDLHPLLKPESRVVTILEQDELYAFNQNFPFNPLNRSGRLDTDNLIDPGNIQSFRWRQTFASKALSLWKRGGDVWITRRVLYQSPMPEWNWVEGDDPKVSWKDIYAFFSEIEMGPSVGGDDGFVLVSPSPHNKQYLSSVAEKNQH